MATHEHRRWGSFAVSAGVLAAAAAAVTLSAQEPAEAHPGFRWRADAHEAGEPLPGLAPELRGLFDQGEQVWLHEFTPEEGLGPVYNERACATCHGGFSNEGAEKIGGPDPIGPGSIHNVVHFGYDNDGLFDGLTELGGPLRERQSIADQIPGCDMPADVVPEQANVLSIRHSPAVWGFGLIDAIPDAEILKRENLGIDGIHGVANWGKELQALNTEITAASPFTQIQGAPRVGRFGWKAQTATLEQFSAEPFNTELGINNQFFPQEQTPSGPKFPDQIRETDPDCDVATHDINDIDQSQAYALYHFQALIAPPPRPRMTGRAMAGRFVFNRLGCQHCHTPTMRTAEQYWLEKADGTKVRVPQLEDRAVHLYSDLLTHDMGDELADDGGETVGRVMGRAAGRRWRTTPLWGLRFKHAYLHDGRTSDLHEAILAHGGEAARARGRFAELTHAEQELVVEFLLSL